MHCTQYLESALRRLANNLLRSNVGHRALLTILISGDAPLKIGVVGLGAVRSPPTGARRHLPILRNNPSGLRVARRDFTDLQTPRHDRAMWAMPGFLREREPSHTSTFSAIDAFSGDSIPVHLITLEALTVYRSTSSQRRDRVSHQQQIPQPGSRCGSNRKHSPFTRRHSSRILARATRPPSTLGAAARRSRPIFRCARPGESPAAHSTAPRLATVD